MLNCTADSAAKGDDDDEDAHAKHNWVSGQVPTLQALLLHHWPIQLMSTQKTQIAVLNNV